jgi:hypothetical protein
VWSYILILKFSDSIYAIPINRQLSTGLELFKLQKSNDIHVHIVNDNALKYQHEMFSSGMVFIQSSMKIMLIIQVPVERAQPYTNFAKAFSGRIVKFHLTLRHEFIQKFDFINYLHNFNIGARGSVVG